MLCCVEQIRSMWLLITTYMGACMLRRQVTAQVMVYFQVFVAYRTWFFYCALCQTHSLTRTECRLPAPPRSAELCESTSSEEEVEAYTHTSASSQTFDHTSHKFSNVYILVMPKTAFPKKPHSSTRTHLLLYHRRYE